MFEFIKNFFSRTPKKKDQEKKKVKSKNIQRTKKLAKPPIPYQVNLISSFKSDHQGLLELHSNIISAAKSRDKQQTTDYISQFSQELSEHLRVEYTDLYVFLEFFASQYLLVEKETIREFRLEMHEITTTVMGIINKYQSLELESDESFEELISDFTLLGGALVDRISREEATLYPMYDTFAHQFKAESVGKQKINTKSTRRKAA